MKKYLLQVILSILAMAIVSGTAVAQCSICTRTAQQLGEEPAKGLNAGILYLAFAPLAIIGYLGYRWYKSNRN